MARVNYSAKSTVHLTEEHMKKAEALADDDRRTLPQFLSIIVEDALDALPDVETEDAEEEARAT